MKTVLRERLKGVAGEAVEVLSVMEESEPRDWLAHVAGWFITAPGQSPAWDNYVLSVIHLRDIVGVRPAIIHREGATHEVMLWALERREDLEPANPLAWSRLEPVNLMEQIVTSGTVLTSGQLGFMLSGVPF